MNYKNYIERNRGKTLKRYKITRPGAKHVRHELAENNTYQPVIYGCPTPSDDIGLKIRNKIILTEADAIKLAHMQLVEVPMHDAPLEIKTTGNVGNSTTQPSSPLEVSALETSERNAVDVPANWHELPVAARKKLASAILGQPVRQGSEANNVIKDYVRDSQHA